MAKDSIATPFGAAEFGTRVFLTQTELENLAGLIEFQRDSGPHAQEALAQRTLDKLNKALARLR